MVWVTWTCLYKKLITPAVKGAECSCLWHIVHQDATVSAAVERNSKTLKPLLTRCVPYLAQTVPNYASTTNRLCHIISLHHCPERIEYELRSSQAPDYLASSFQCMSDVMNRRHLCSVATSQLIAHATRCSTLGNRAFPVAAARAWNSLPHSVTSAPTLPNFKRLLKIHLFHRSFCLSNAVVQCSWSGFHCDRVTLILLYMNE